ncbi:hypothetical protein [Phenylobacterium sp. 58.2.17]|uniref:hypothetical protein n=1 Tax=Phenylobacterium sp. 58.2.17 TaxID=2969306 RepID=UPI002264EBD7|nr:hypothetical protein [Phenylobacterium sp. 58.2.17]MCX7587189.1 hypothetical protein [Phenylobacterium sp. 58.2.17]
MRVPLKIPPGLNGDDTAYAAVGRWADCNNVRFDRDFPQVIGGWESLTASLLAGVCRTVFQWTDSLPTLNIAFGTHSALQVWLGGSLYDITPALAKPAFALLDAGATVTNGSPTITVVKTAHGLTTGDSVVVSGGIGVGRLAPAGAYTVTVADANTFTITAGSNAQLSKTLGSNPLSVTSGSPTVTVTETGHNISTGTSITVSGASALGGITPNGTFVATRIDANSYRFNFTSGATSTATGGGASVAVAVPATGGIGMTFGPQDAFAAGSIDGTGGAGYGTGAYSVGGYSEPSTSDYFPRTWALAAWGQQLLANPRGGTIYAWANVTADKAAPLTNAPAKVTHMLVAPQDMVFALGCNQEASNAFDPLCIRHSSVRNNSEWHTAAGTTAREYVLPGGGRIVAGRVAGSSLLVWTNHSLFQGTFIGALATPWRFDRVATNCGLIGPNAAVVVGQAAYWLGVDGQFYRYGLGGGVEPIPCAIRDDLFGNITPGQADKITAASNSRFSEVRWDYPDERDGTENSRYVALSLVGQGWHRGRMPRTAMADAGPSQDPIGVTAAGNVYWHERGQSADGSALSWSIETADQYLNEEQTALVLGLWPDLKSQVGPINISITSRFKPQGDETTKGPYPVAAGEDKVDVRASGRLFKLKFEGASVPAFARFGQIAVDLAAAGDR